GRYGVLRNSCWPGLEIILVPKEIPPIWAVRRWTDGQRTYAGSISSLIHRPPVLRTLQGDDRVEFPAFQRLTIALLAGDGVGERKREAMPHIEIAVGIFGAGVVSVLRQSRSVTEIPVCSHVIESVRVGVSGYHAQAMEISGVQGHLQTVVIGPIDISHLEDVCKVWELSRERPVGFFGAVGVDCAVAIASAGTCQAKVEGACTTRIGVPARAHRRLVNVANAG